MKILLAVFISLFSLNVSAQFYTKLFRPKIYRLPQLTAAYSAPYKPVPPILYSASFNTFNSGLGRSRYSINAEEAFIMKNLRRSARFGQGAMRVEFDHLAAFYFSQNRFSEAKWYLLRSNAISRQQNNYTRIIGSLLILADVKSNLGDYKQANADLSEAKNIAASHGLLPDLLLIEQHTKQIRLNKDTGLKFKNHYADLL